MASIFRLLISGLIILELSGYAFSFECNTIVKNNGMTPPILPESFVWKAEVTNLLTNSSGWEEMYFDAKNVRAKYKYVLDSIERNYIFDYDVDQIFSFTKFKPGAYIGRDPQSRLSCKAVDMQETSLRNLFGFKNSAYQTKKLRMFTSNEVLRFGEPYSFAFVERSKQLLNERGVFTDAFHSCINEKWIGITANVTYFWSGENALPPSGDKAEDNHPLSRPLKVVFVGSNNSDNSGSAVVNSSHSIVWFTGKPTFTDSDFQVPLRTYCEGYRSKKEMRITLPELFSTRIEITKVSRDADGKRLSSMGDYSEICYDKNIALIRRDFTLNDEDSYQDIRTEFPGVDFISSVYDFNTGTVYWIEPTTGRCVPKAIVADDPMVKKDTVGLQMAEPAVVLHIGNTDEVVYKGKYIVRDIKCHVWGQKMETEEATSRSTVYQEYYFPAEGFHSVADNENQFEVPVRSAIFNFTRIKANSKARPFSIVDRNFFKFNKFPPSVSVFDISSCMEHFDHRYFRLTFEGMVSTMMKFKLKLMDAAKMAVCNYGVLTSCLRIQEMQVTPVNSRVMFIKFAIMEKSNIQGELPRPVESGSTLKDAVENITNAITRGDLTVEVVVDSLREPITLIATKFEEINTLTSSAGDVLLAESFTKESPRGSDTDEESSSLYSSGSLATLAIFMLLIGAAIGIGLMVFYHRRYGLTRNSNPAYRMEQRG